MNYHDLQTLLKHSEEHVYPLVNNKNDKIFLCQIQRFALERHIFKQELAYRKLVAEAEDSDSSSSSDESAIAHNIKKWIDLDLKDIKTRHKQEKRDRKRRRKARKHKKREQEKLALQQHVQQQLQIMLQQQQNPQVIPQNPNLSDSSNIQELVLSLPEKPSTEKLFQQTQDLTDKILKEKSKKSKKNYSSKQPPPTHDEYFSRKCGFDNLAKYLASHGIAGNEELVQPALDPTRAVEGEVDNTGVDLCPYTVMETSPLSKVHFMFAVMGLSHVWVVREGRLMGFVAKEDLMNMEKEWAVWNTAKQQMYVSTRSGINRVQIKDF